MVMKARSLGLTIDNELVLRITCPVTFEIFFEPFILTGCGHSFEKSKISLFKDCPSCHHALREAKPNYALQSIVKNILTANPHLADDQYKPSIEGNANDVSVLQNEKENNFIENVSDPFTKEIFRDPVVLTNC